MKRIISVLAAMAVMAAMMAVMAMPAMAKVFPPNPGQEPGGGPPLVSGDFEGKEKGARVIHCNSDLAPGSGFQDDKSVLVIKQDEYQGGGCEPPTLEG